MVIAGGPDNINYYEWAQVFSFADFLAYGFTAASDPLVFAEVSDFYNNVGDGAELNFMVVPGAAGSNPTSDLTIPDNFPMPLELLLQYPPGTVINGATVGTYGGGRDKLQAFINSMGGRCSVLLINTDFNYLASVSGTPTLFQNLNRLVPLLDDIAMYNDNNNKPLVIGIPGIGFSSTTDAVWNSTPAKSDYVFVNLACQSMAGFSMAPRCMGLLAARMYNYQVCSSIARVASGEVTQLNTSCLPDCIPVETIQDKWEQLAAQKFIFYRTFEGRTGYYYSDDPTFTTDTSDYGGIAWNRVINKGKRIGYQVLLDKLNDDIQEDPNTGLIETAVLSDWESDVINAISASMLTKPATWPSNKEWVKEITGVTCKIDPNSDIANGQVSAAIRIQRKGIAKQFNVSIGYTSTSGGA
jgi:hypothetical protein